MKSMKVVEPLNTSMNVNETDNKNYSSELIKREQIGETPFTAIKTEQGGWFVTIGKYRVSEEYKTKAEVVKLVEKKDWGLIMNVITVVTETLAELKTK